jgi:hypothetical protein
MRSRDERKADFERREVIRKERYQASKDARAVKRAELDARTRAAREARRPAPPAPTAGAVPRPVRDVSEPPRPAPLVLPAKGERLTDEQLASLQQIAAVLNISSEGFSGIFNQPSIQQSRDAVQARRLILWETQARIADAKRSQDEQLPD